MRHPERRILYHQCAVCNCWSGDVFRIYSAECDEVAEATCESLEIILWGRDEVVS